MARFAVVLTAGLPAAENKISEHYGKYIKLTEDVFIISDDTNVTDIMEKLDIKEEDSPLEGIVFSLNGSYGGRGARRVWDWLESN